MRLLHAVEQQFQQPVVVRDFILNPTIAYLAALLSPEADFQSPNGEERTAPYIAPDVNRGHGTQIAVWFHGRMHQFRTGFAELALLAHAQIFFVASDLQAYNCFSFRLVGPFDMGSAAMRYEERVQHLMDQYIEQLRRQWAQNPWTLPWWLMREHLAFPSVEVGKSEVYTLSRGQFAPKEILR